MDTKTDNVKIYYTNSNKYRNFKNHKIVYIFNKNLVFLLFAIIQGLMMIRFMKIIKNQGFN